MDSMEDSDQRRPFSCAHITHADDTLKPELEAESRLPPSPAGSSSPHPAFQSRAVMAGSQWPPGPPCFLCMDGLEGVSQLTCLSLDSSNLQASLHPSLLSSVAPRQFLAFSLCPVDDGL